MKTLLIGLLAAAALAGCTSSGPAAPSSGTTHTRTKTQTRPPHRIHFKPAPATSVAPLPPGAKPPRGEKDHLCPYLPSGKDEDPVTSVRNLADLEGDRVYRTTLLTRYHPVGCRFYFYSGPFEAIADILPRRFATAADAYNAMVLTARKGRNQIAEQDFVKGLTGICYQTRFFGPDGPNDWAFVFAKGRTMVIVHTQQSDTSRNALYIGKAIAGKF